MLTLFTVPKAFRGHVAIIQRNAIRSWVKLDPTCEVILFGDDEGTRDTAGDLGVRHVPQVRRNARGTPLLDSVFATADRIARNDLLCYVNADIMLTHDLMSAIRRIPWRMFLLVGRRWDVEVREAWNFDGPRSEERLRALATAAGKLHPPAGSDYFVFRRGTFPDFPAFAVGRPGWDNWVIYYARTARIPVVDGTPVVLVIHQNHDYAHIPADGDTRERPEAEYNRQLAGQWPPFTLEDADWVLTAAGVTRIPWFVRNLRRRVLASAAVRRTLGLLVRLASAPRRTVGALRHRGN